MEPFLSLIPQSPRDFKWNINHNFKRKCSCKFKTNHENSPLRGLKMRLPLVSKVLLMKMHVRDSSKILYLSCTYIASCWLFDLRHPLLHPTLSCWVFSQFSDIFHMNFVFIILALLENFIWYNLYVCALLGFFLWYTVPLFLIGFLK